MTVNRFFQIVTVILLSCCFFCKNKELPKQSTLSQQLPKGNGPKPDKTSAEEDDRIDIEKASVKADEYYFDGDSALWVQKHFLGCWFTPHAAEIHILFKDDGTFEFNDYNARLKKEESLTGRFDINVKEERLILIYGDRPRQTFLFQHGEYPDDNYYIKNATGYFFVKGSCE